MVQNFSSAIALRMISCAHAQLGPIELEELLPEATHEDWISVGNYTFRKAMKLAYHVDEKLSNTVGCEIGG